MKKQTKIRKDKQTRQQPLELKMKKYQIMTKNNKKVLKQTNEKYMLREWFRLRSETKVEHDNNLWSPLPILRLSAGTV